MYAGSVGCMCEGSVQWVYVRGGCGCVYKGSVGCV